MGLTIRLMSLFSEQVYPKLRDTYGPAALPAAESPLAALVGAALAQNTAPPNVEQALANLREAGVLSIESLNQIGDELLSEMLHPAGHVRQKTRRLKNLVRLIVEEYDGSLDALFSLDTESLREQLLSLNSVGPETADVLLLFAAHKPRFPVGAATARILKRHGWMEFEADYHAIQEYVESGLEGEPQVYGELHAWLARIGQDYCRKTPHCTKCPLRDVLPEGGPLEPEWLE